MQRPGTRVSTMWWEKEGLDLAEAAALEGGMYMVAREVGGG